MKLKMSVAIILQCARSEFDLEKEISHFAHGLIDLNTNAMVTCSFPSSRDLFDHC